MTRVVVCVVCGEAERFDLWPEADDEDALDALIRSEDWGYDGLDEFCPDHNPAASE